MATGIADFNNDDWLSTSLVHDVSGKSLVLRIRAKQKIKLTEIQGFKSDLEAFELTVPEGFESMLFGQGSSVPESMKSDVEHMNRLNFRWGCSYTVQPGAALEIRVPATGLGKDRLVLTLAYEYPKLLGIMSGKNGFYARMAPE